MAAKTNDAYKAKEAARKEKEREKARRDKERERAAKERDREKARKQKEKERAAKEREREKARKQKEKERAAKEREREKAAKAPAKKAGAKKAPAKAAGTGAPKAAAKKAPGKAASKAPAKKAAAKAPATKAAAKAPAKKGATKAPAKKAGGGAATEYGEIAQQLGKTTGITRSTKRPSVAASYTTRDHDVIRAWAESRGGRPAGVEGTGGGDDPGVLRIDFVEGDPTPDDRLEGVGWEAFFEKFDANDLDFLYQERKANGETSTFHKFVRPDS